MTKAEPVLSLNGKFIGVCSQLLRAVYFDAGHEGGEREKCRDESDHDNSLHSVVFTFREN